jgi:hypothetical protein
MRFRLSKHAQDEITKRGISLNDIDAVVQAPQ